MTAGDHDMHGVTFRAEELGMRQERELAESPARQALCFNSTEKEAAYKMQIERRAESLVMRVSSNRSMLNGLKVHEKGGMLIQGRAPTWRMHPTRALQHHAGA